MDNTYSYFLLTTAKEKLADYQNKLMYQIFEIINDNWIGPDGEEFKIKIILIKNAINEIIENIDKLIMILRQSQQ